MSGKRVERLKRRALRLLEDARADFEQGFYDLSCFHSEQALQLFVKAIVFELFAKEYAGHGLRELLGYLSKLLRESDYNELAERIDEHIRNNRSLLVDLENSYIDARYVDFEYDK